MSADATTVRYKCPFCDVDKSSRKKIKRHVTSKEEGKHQNVNGFKMDKTIEAYEVKQDDDGNEEMKSITEVDQNEYGVQGTEIDNKIEKAASYFDAVDEDSITEIAEEASVSKGRVMRVFKEAGVDYTTRGKCEATSWDELTDSQQSILTTYHKLGSSATYTDIGEEIDVDKSYVRQTVMKYKWMLLNEYCPEHLLNDEYSNEVGVEDDVDEMMETFDGSTSTNDDESDEFTSEADERFEVINKLSSAGVEFELDVEVVDDDFEAIKKLIKAGYDDIAEELFKE